MNVGQREQKVQEALLLLLDACEYAQDAEMDIWAFSIEIEQLRAMGLNDNDFRWLASKGYVEHRVEMTLFGDETRSFHSAGTFKFNGCSCFVLCPAGVSVARSLRAETQHVRDSRPTADAQDVKVVSTEQEGAREGEAQEQVVPAWDGERHELRLGKYLVKRFKRPAPNQEAILAAFQEEGWPPCVADPLSPLPDTETKRRLNDTIKSLNRNQKKTLLRFMGDGTAEGVIWELADGNGQD